MSLPKLNDNLNVIQSLPDKPSIQATELKKKFDEGNNKIKKYINENLIPAVEEQKIDIVDDLNTGGVTKALSAEQGKLLNMDVIRKQNKINYGITVPSLAEGEIFIQIF